MVRSFASPRVRRRRRSSLSGPDFNAETGVRYSERCPYRAWPGSSVGTSDRLKSGRSPVRSRPWPQTTVHHSVGRCLFRSRGGTSQHVVLGGPGPSHKLRSTIWWAVVCSSELSGSRGIWFGSAVPSRPLRERASLVNGDSLGCRQESTYQSCRFVRRPCCRRR